MILRNGSNQIIVKNKSLLFKIAKEYGLTIDSTHHYVLDNPHNCDYVTYNSILFKIQYVDGCLHPYIVQPLKYTDYDYELAIWKQWQRIYLNSWCGWGKFDSHYRKGKVHTVRVGFTHLRW